MPNSDGVDTFVRQATRGLRGQARRDAQAELRSHLHERTGQLMGGGLSLEAAQMRAQAELGPTKAMSQGFQQSHSLSAPGRWLTLLALPALFSAALTMGIMGGPWQAAVQGQLERWSTGGSACGEDSRCTQLSAHWWKPENLHTVNLVRPQELAGLLPGTQITGAGRWKKLTLPGAAPLTLNDYRFTVHAGPLPVSLIPHATTVYSELLLDARRQGWPVKLGGSTQAPRLSLAGQTLPDSTLNMLTMLASYQHQLSLTLTQVAPETNGWTVTPTTVSRQPQRRTMGLKLPTRTGQVYALLIAQHFTDPFGAPDGTYTEVNLSFGEPGLNGKTFFPVPQNMRGTSPAGPVTVLNTVTRWPDLIANAGRAPVALLISVPFALNPDQRLPGQGLPLPDHLTLTEPH